MRLQPRGAGGRIVADAAHPDGDTRHASAAQALHLACADVQVRGKLFGGQHARVSIGLVTPQAPTLATWVS
jgi:hypothetical protein